MFSQKQKYVYTKNSTINKIKLHIKFKKTVTKLTMFGKNKKAEK
jgi:hypothetical protein